jgi:flavin-dependent dehydrogenase
MFVGDAGRLVHPASGAGIHNAVVSGSLAGLIAAKYIQNEVTSLKDYQDALEKKCAGIIKTYNNKSKLTSSEKFIKGFSRAFFIIHLLNKLFPNFFQGRVAKILQKDEKIIKSFK